MQQITEIGRFLLKVLVVLCILRVLLISIGLQIVEYLPIVDDINNLLLKGMTNISSYLANAVNVIQF